MRPFGAIVRLCRLDSSILGAAIVFVPHYARSGELYWSITQALPILFICIATFVANDLDDLRSDALNHPRRPLVVGTIPPWVGTTVFFSFLSAALFSTKAFVRPGLDFWYYGLMAASTSYGYLLSGLRILKGPFVAGVVAATVLLAGVSYPDDPSFRRIALGAFLATLGRETVMDVKDRPGDAPSALSCVPGGLLVALASGLQMVAVAIAAWSSTRSLDHLAGAIMIVVLALGTASWYGSRRPGLAIGLMKVAFAVGLVLLA